MFDWSYIDWDYIENRQKKEENPVKYDNTKVKRKTSMGDYEYVVLKINYIETREINGFPPHISWHVNNGNSWHFESLTQFKSESFEKFLERNGMVLC